jgi:tRNA pseudouridine38-40 synthase
VANGIRLIVAYDGAGFAGFVSQRDQRTVQGELERAITEMNGAPVVVRVAGRTDAGVHAAGQVVAFDADREIPPLGWRRGLNRKLPGDVVVRDADVADVGYNPRFDALDKTYRYVIQAARDRDPLMQTRAWSLGKSRQLRREFERVDDATERLDLAAMRAAAARFVGTHDFHALRSADDDRRVTVRRIFSFDVIESFGGEPSLVALEVRGNAFLRNMMRILAGTLVEVGRGRMAPETIDRLVSPEARREDAGVTAPAHGLTLLHVTLGRLAEAARASKNEAPPGNTA